MFNDPFAMIPMPRVQEMLAQARAQAAAEEREACLRIVRKTLEGDLVRTAPTRTAHEAVKWVELCIRARKGPTVTP